jgi:hypothetical protein
LIVRFIDLFLVFRRAVIGIAAGDKGFHKSAITLIVTVGFHCAKFEDIEPSAAATDPFLQEYRITRRIDGDQQSDDKHCRKQQYEKGEGYRYVHASFYDEMGIPMRGSAAVGLECRNDFMIDHFLVTKTLSFVYLTLS